jgi:hypothetical protein
MSDEPAQQELPMCWRHPRLRCPGECQYQLMADECIHELPGPMPMSAPAEAATAPTGRQQAD